MRTQVNVRLSKSTKRRVELDRKSTAATNDIIVEVALENWFSKYAPEDRARFYKAHDRRPYARI